MAEAWDRRRKSESLPAWAAWVKYRDMGHERTCQKVATELGRSLTLITGWSARHGWVDRAAAYDDHIDRIAQAETIKAVVEMRRRHAELAVGFQSAVARRLMGADGVAKLDLDTLTATEMERWVRTAVAIEREARGEAASTVEVRTPVDLSIEALLAAAAEVRAEHDETTPDTG